MAKAFVIEQMTFGTDDNGTPTAYTWTVGFWGDDLPTHGAVDYETVSVPLSTTGNGISAALISAVGDLATSLNYSVASSDIIVPSYQNG